MEFRAANQCNQCSDFLNQFRKSPDVYSVSESSKRQNKKHNNNKQQQLFLFKTKTNKQIKQYRGISPKTKLTEKYVQFESGESMKSMYRLSKPV